MQHFGMASDGLSEILLHIVREVVFFGCTLHKWRKLFVMHMADIWKQMMLNLKIKPAYIP